MNRIALLVSLAFAALGGTMLWLYKQRFEAEVRGGPPVAVAMLARDVPLGGVLSEADIAIRTVPGQYVEGRQVRAADVASVIGVRTANQLRSNESLLWTDLAAPSTFARNLSGLVRVGMRAVALSVDGADFSGLLRPGDRVDLLLTVNRGSKAQSTHAVAQAVLVVAVGADTGGGEERSERDRRARGVTVALSAEQAALVTHARGLGDLAVVLRNPDDVAMVDLDDAVHNLAAATAALADARAGDAELARITAGIDALADRARDGNAGADALDEQLRAIEQLGKAAAEGAGAIPPGLPRPAEVSP